MSEVFVDELSYFTVPIALVEEDHDLIREFNPIEASATGFFDGRSSKRAS